MPRRATSSPCPDRTGFRTETGADVSESDALRASVSQEATGLAPWSVTSHLEKNLKKGLDTHQALVYYESGIGRDAQVERPKQHGVSTTCTVPKGDGTSVHFRFPSGALEMPHGIVVRADPVTHLSRPGPA